MTSKIERAEYGHPMFETREQMDARAASVGTVTCDYCLEREANEDDLCRECWNEINGQFGVGA